MHRSRAALGLFAALATASPAWAADVVTIDYDITGSTASVGPSPLSTQVGTATIRMPGAVSTTTVTPTTGIAVLESLAFSATGTVTAGTTGGTPVGINTVAWTLLTPLTATATNFNITPTGATGSLPGAFRVALGFFSGTATGATTFTDSFNVPVAFQSSAFTVFTLGITGETAPLAGFFGTPVSVSLSGREVARTTSVPEPGRALLLASSAVGIALLGRRRSWLRRPGSRA